MDNENFTKILEQQHTLVRGKVREGTNYLDIFQKTCNLMYSEYIFLKILFLGRERI